MLKQTCVYWAPALDDSGSYTYDNYGKVQYQDAVELACRWQDRAEEFLNGDGDLNISNSIVFTGVDVTVKGVLMLGTLSDVTDEDEPLNNTTAHEIKRFDKIPTLKATKFLRKAYL